MEAANVLFYTSVFTTIPYILEQNYKFKESQDLTRFQGSITPEEETFDYIVVGGGSAGSVMANRLSRNRRNKVLLLERGGDPDPLQEVPFHAAMQVTPWTDYGYHTEPQANCFFASGNIFHDIRGRGLGGSGNLNYMMYQRGPSKQYDEWAEIVGDEIWSWENVLPYFKRAEKYHGFHQPMDTEFHSDRGEIIVSSPSFKPSAEPFFAACKEFGMNVEDLNTGVHNSPVFDFVEYKINNGKRWGPYQAFIVPALRRTNLKIYRYAQVVKVNVDENMRATGVTYVRHNVTRTVNANKEIILSAGSYDTPKILMLSGIGPKQHLESFKIPVLKDLPVGKNHQDHIGTIIDKIQFDTPNVAFDPARDLTPATFVEYKIRGTGPLSVPGGFFATGYYSTPKNVDPEIPDIQYFITSMYAIGNPLVLPSPVQAIKNMKGAPDANTIVLILGRPKSNQGQLRLKSTDPNDQILIDPKYFTDESDMERLIDGIKFILELYENTAVYRDLGAKVILTVADLCKDEEYRSDAFWKCYIRYITGTIYHPVGGCRMGKVDDPTSVVDSKLRVIGISGLRIADGSVMPKIVNCNTQVPIYMIAEVASQLIAQDSKKNVR